MSCDLLKRHFNATDDQLLCTSGIHHAEHDSSIRCENSQKTNNYLKNDLEYVFKIFLWGMNLFRGYWKSWRVVTTNHLLITHCEAIVQNSLKVYSHTCHTRTHPFLNIYQVKCAVCTSSGWLRAAVQEATKTIVSRGQCRNLRIIL